MTKEEFIKSKHFDHWGFIPPLDCSKGGRYTHVTRVQQDNNIYDILCDYDMNFYYCLAFPHGVVVDL